MGVLGECQLLIKKADLLVTSGDPCLLFNDFRSSAAMVKVMGVTRSTTQPPSLLRCCGT